MQSVRKETPAKLELVQLSEITEKGRIGRICIRVSSVSAPLTSRNGWKYRKLHVQDDSMEAEMLVSEEKYSEWKFKTGDQVVCEANSSGVGNDGKLGLFFNDLLGPFETGKLVYELNRQLAGSKARGTDHMKSGETVYQISAREAKSLLELIKLWILEGKPQHYTKWCQMHQIVATNLYYMGLVKRTSSMSGLYYPTQDALEFFEGKRSIPKKRVFVKGEGGKHVLVGDEGESKSFSDYLHDYSDRETALKEYTEALKSYRERYSDTKQQG
jgi:hypothetical protein